MSKIIDEEDETTLRDVLKFIDQRLDILNDPEETRFYTTDRVRHNFITIQQSLLGFCNKHSIPLNLEGRNMTETEENSIDGR